MEVLLRESVVTRRRQPPCAVRAGQGMRRQSSVIKAGCVVRGCVFGACPQSPSASCRECVVRMRSSVATCRQGMRRRNASSVSMSCHNVFAQCGFSVRSKVKMVAPCSTHICGYPAKSPGRPGYVPNPHSAEIQLNEALERRLDEARICRSQILVSGPGSCSVYNSSQSMGRVGQI